MTRRPSIQIAGLDHLRHDRAVRRHGHDDLLRLVGHDRGVGHQQRRRGRPSARRRRANCPGVMSRSGLGTVARAWIVPLLRFTRVVDEVERAVAVEMAVAVQADRDVGVRRRRRGCAC